MANSTHVVRFDTAQTLNESFTKLVSDHYPVALTLLLPGVPTTAPTASPTAAPTLLPTTTPTAAGTSAAANAAKGAAGGEGSSHQTVRASPPDECERAFVGWRWFPEMNLMSGIHSSA